MNYKDASLSIEERVEDLLGRMTLDEMAAQLGSYWIYQLDDGKNLSHEKAQRLLHDGIGQITRVSGGSSLKPDEAAEMANQIQKYLVEETRLGIPAMIHEEACSGFTAIGATTFPQTIGVASTFDPKLSEQIGQVIGRQMRAAGAHQALAPLLDIARDPRWGRMEETYGEDPYVVGTMGTAYVKGIQGNLKDQGVLATGKHFVGYGASEGGMNWAPVHLPERELREVYLAPFEMAVKEGNMASIMNGYHEIDGVPCGASKKLLNDILKEEWGFEGIVVSDYFAINQIFDYHNMAADKEEAAKMALEAGMDVELPNVDCFGEPLKRAVEKGDISMELIHTSVRKVLTFKFRLGLFEHPYVDAKKTMDQFDTPQDRQLALEAARKSIILLKNENRLLPLSKDIKKLAVIGPSADNIRHMIGDYTYQGQIEGLLELHDS
ncbi:MAG: glycoside hydrolase family 3 protein, partial [Clostridiales bacterium]|nr:glycoside hydrolase family 3 protein [Clostridiales bacterium]